MSFVALCTFDLKNASTVDYETAYSELSKLGLSKVQATSSGGTVVIPTTTTLGTFTGLSAAAIRDDLQAKIRAVFAARRLKAELFVVVGGTDWGWSAATT